MSVRLFNCCVVRNFKNVIMVNEILQWIVIVYILWVIYSLANAINSILECIDVLGKNVALNNEKFSCKHEKV